MIPNNIGALLTPIALAYLICDDEILNKVERICYFMYKFFQSVESSTSNNSS